MLKRTKKMVTVISVLAALVLVPAVGLATVLLEDDFSGDTLDTTKWLPLTGSGTAAVSLTGAGELKVDLSAGVADVLNYAYGIVSNEGFTIPTDKVLVVDYYGTNYSDAGSSDNSVPLWMITPHRDLDSDGVVKDLYWYPYHASIRGASTDWKPYWMMDHCLWAGPDAPAPVNIFDAGARTYGNYKHTIMTIDHTNVKYYIEDDFYSPSMTPVLTNPVGNSFRDGCLEGGLYVNLLAGTRGALPNATWEKFDGVKVSLIPEPATLGLLVMGGLALIRRKW